jgi:hypothetical protein
MRRREFVQLVAGTATVWTLAGHAQQPERVRRVGVLLGFPEDDPFTRRIVPAFAQALRRFGWVEGKNIVIDYRFAVGDPTLYKTYAAELVGLGPDAILASPSTSGAITAGSTFPTDAKVCCRNIATRAVNRGGNGERLRKEGDVARKTRGVSYTPRAWRPTRHDEPNEPHCRSSRT